MPAAHDDFASKALERKDAKKPFLRPGEKQGDIKDIEERHCTDVLFLIIFVVMWLGMLVLGVGSYVTGDPTALSYGTDYQGNRCGVGEFESKPVVWFPRMTADLVEQAALITQHPTELVLYGLCLETCPTLHDPPYVEDYGWPTNPGAKQHRWPVAMSTFNAVNRCLPEITSNESVSTFCEYPKCTQAGEPCVATVVGGLSDVWRISSPRHIKKCQREVILSVDTTTKQPMGEGPASAVIEWFLTVASTANHAMRMLTTHTLAIWAYGVGLATLLGFFWMSFLFLCAGAAVYLALAAVFLVLLVLALGFAYKGGVGGAAVQGFLQGAINGTLLELEHAVEGGVMEGVVQSGVVRSVGEAILAHSEAMATTYRLLAGVSVLFLLLYTVLLCVSSGQIGRTVSLVKEATLCVHNSKAMVFFPVLISLLQLLLICFCTLSFVGMHTSPAASYRAQLAAVSHTYASALDASGAAGLMDEGDSAVGDFFDSLQRLDADEVLWYEGLYLGFGFVWTYFFFAAIGTTTISGCVVYYFFMDEDTAGHKNAQFADNQTDFVVSKMLYYTLRYNLGSMAFGSLVLAVVEVLVWLLEIIDDQTKAEGQSNPVMRLVLKCSKCCLFCFERCIKFVSSYAYIFVFMQNTGFCMACFRTWSMMAKYPLQLGINRVVQRVLFAMQSITIPLVCTSWAYWTFLTAEGTFLKLLTPDLLIAAMVPALCVLVLSTIVARSFASVYEQVVTALTTCVLTDIEQYNAKYARSQLREAFDLPPKELLIDEFIRGGGGGEGSSAGSRSSSAAASRKGDKSKH
jgi:choline transporter-like protein 2/4/5